MARYKVFTINKYNIREIVLVFVLMCHLVFMYPSVLPFFLPIPSVSILTGGFIILYSFFLFSYRTISLPCKSLNSCFIIQLITWLVLCIISRDSVYITRIVFLLNAFLAMICIWNTKESYRKFENTYITFIAILGIGGVIAFFLVLFNMITPLFTYENLDGRIGYFYGFTCTNAQLANVIRYSGVFDEPGAMAFWGMIALVINQFSIQNKKLERIIIICLIFTFSMAYYIQIFFYIIFFKIKSFKGLLWMVSILLIAISAIRLTKDSEFDLYTPTVMRFEIGDDGELNGDTRSDSSKIAKIYFIDSPIIGNGPSITTKGEYMADNPFENLATDGILGTFVMYIPLILLLYPYNRQIYLGLFIIMLGYLQRPFHQNFMHAFILYFLSYIFLQYKISSAIKNEKRESQNICRYSLL